MRKLLSIHLTSCVWARMILAGVTTMSFKSLDKQEKSPAYLEYVQAVAEYKAACIINSRVKKALKDSPDPMDRLKFYEQKELFSKQCKAYYAAREKYAKAKIMEIAEKRGVKELSGLALAKVIGMEIPMNMAAMLTEAKQQEARERVMADPELKALYEELLKNQNNITKDMFMKKQTPIDDDPFYGDFSPLEEDDEEKEK